MAKMGNIDISEFIKLRDNLNKLNDPKIKEKFMRECVKEIAMETLRKTIKLTKVGKKPILENDTKEVEIAGTKTITRKAGKGTVSYQAKTKKKIKMLTAQGAKFQEIWKGYVGGTLRRGWIAKSQAEAENSTYNAENKIEEKSKEIALRVAKVGDSYVAWIINTVEYASFVEYGHRQTPGRYVPAIGKRLKKSWVPGRHMLQISMLEVEKKLPQFLDAKMQEYLNQVFGGEK